jgi:hypothetical protein
MEWLCTYLKIKFASVNALKFLDTKFALAFLKNKTETINILNQLRYKLTTTPNKSAKTLPPTNDAFCQHVLRY